jgi:hypothetical protein
LTPHLAFKANIASKNHRQLVSGSSLLAQGVPVSGNAKRDVGPGCGDSFVEGRERYDLDVFTTSEISATEPFLQFVRWSLTECLGDHQGLWLSVREQRVGRVCSVMQSSESYCLV